MRWSKLIGAAAMPCCYVWLRRSSSSITNIVYLHTNWPERDFCSGSPAVGGDLLGGVGGANEWVELKRFTVRNLQLSVYPRLFKIKNRKFGSCSKAEIGTRMNGFVWKSLNAYFILSDSKFSFIFIVSPVYMYLITACSSFITYY